MENKSFNYYHQALLVEYNAITESRLSRGRMRQTLENFIIVILSAFFVSYSTIVAEGLFLVLPIVSIFLTGLAFSIRQQSVVAWRLWEYETILQKNMIALIQSSVKNTEELPPRLEYLWGWQSFYLQRGQKNNKFKSLTIKLVNSGIAIIIPIIAISLPIAFLVHKKSMSFTMIEHLLFWTSSVYALSLTILFIKDKFF